MALLHKIERNLAFAFLAFMLHLVASDDTSRNKNI